MCVVSNIGDQFAQKYPFPTSPPSQFPSIYFPGSASRAEFDALKAEVENLKKLLKLAKIIDETSGQPDCEMDEKVELIRRVAELVGVDMSDVFG